MLCTEFGHIPCGKMGGICARTIEAGDLGIPNVPLWHSAVAEDMPFLL